MTRWECDPNYPGPMLGLRAWRFQEASSPAVYRPAVVTESSDQGYACCHKKGNDGSICSSAQAAGSSLINDFVHFARIQISLMLGLRIALDAHLTPTSRSNPFPVTYRSNAENLSNIIILIVNSSRSVLHLTPQSGTTCIRSRRVVSSS